MLWQSKKSQLDSGLGSAISRIQRSDQCGAGICVGPCDRFAILNKKRTGHNHIFDGRDHLDIGLPPVLSTLYGLIGAPPPKLDQAGKENG